MDQGTAEAIAVIENQLRQFSQRLVDLELAQKALEQKMDSLNMLRDRVSDIERWLSQAPRLGNED